MATHTPKKTLIAAITLILALGGVATVAWLVFGQLVDTSRPPAPFWSERDDRASALHLRPRRGVPRAELPWLLSWRNPEEVLLAAPELPWSARALPGTTGSAPITLTLAALPTQFPRRVAADEPLPARVPLAQLPWRPRPLGTAPARLEPATVPPLKRVPDPRKPDAAALPPARVPWERTTRPTTPAKVPPAELPAFKQFEERP